LADPPSREHLRLEIVFEGNEQTSIFYWDRRGLGSVRLLSPAQMEAALGPAKLGPDALRITAQQLRDRLGTSRREIKPALLDQRAVAGIGNLYASEILFLARLDPKTACCELTRKQWGEILRVTKSVLNTAIRYEGSTLGDGTYRNALNKAGGYQNQHRVYDKAGQRCRRCRDAEIVRIVQTQRATFYCPACQM
jgi:formamidopyrimidine-DNA glycosylase